MANPITRTGLSRADPSRQSAAASFLSRISAIVRWARAYPQLAVGGTVLLLLTCIALFAPIIAPYGPSAIDATALLQTPNSDHFFGTDTLGRDTFSRIVYGARITLFVGLAAVISGMVAGVLLGLISGYSMGWTDSVIMRTMDGVMSFPNLILALTIAFALGPSLFTIIVALSIVRVPASARLTRGQVLTLRNQDFILAAEAVGANPVRIIFRYYLPNIVSVILVEVTLGAGAVIFAAASLGFLGLGVPPPAPSWGGMLRDGYVFLEVNPWQSIMPGAFIFLAILGFNFLGDGLRDAFDPQQRRRLGR